jgi:SAM-dependent methyltransferase
VVQSPVPVVIVHRIAACATLAGVLVMLAGIAGIAGIAVTTVRAERPSGASGQTIGGTQAPTRLPDIFCAPTLCSVADDMLKLAAVTARDVVYDLGSGDGRILILAAQKYGAKGVGVEIDHRLVELSRQIAREGEVADRLTFIEGDLFDVDISPATVVTLYLSPPVNKRLEPKLRAQLRPGTRIVSHQFGIGTWMPDKVIRAEGDRTELFLWTIPSH